MLTEIQNKFLDLLLESGALKFGNFQTKSGRMSPFFFNSGAFNDGLTLKRVAQCYASFILSDLVALAHHDLHLYGPAYKGITLASATAMELASISGRNVSFTFNRKEQKNHGEGGAFIGRDISKSSSLIVIEDVMTGGTSVRETLDILQPMGAGICAVLVGVDREERGAGDVRASVEISSVFGIPVFSILTINEIINALWMGDSPVVRVGKTWLDSDLMSRIKDYRRQWGR